MNVADAMTAIDEHAAAGPIGGVAAGRAARKTAPAVPGEGRSAALRRRRAAARQRPATSSAEPAPKNAARAIERARAADAAISARPRAAKADRGNQRRR